MSKKFERYQLEIPVLVQQATSLAEELGFPLMIGQVLKTENWDNFTEIVKIGEIVFDDRLPLELWPPDWEGLVVAKHEFVYRNPRLIGTEIRITPSQVAIIAIRIS